MATYQTREEATQQYISRMGEPLGLTFSALWQELAWLYLKWNEFVELYGTKPSRIALLNEAASGFFSILQESLFDDTLLHISRLTDPATTGKRENLTIQRLPLLIADDVIRRSVSALIEQAITKASFCRDQRNRRIAHRDLALALAQPARPLEEASRLKVKEALKAIEDTLNEVTAHYMDTTTAFSIAQSHHGAVSLLYIINDGVRVDKQRLEMLQRGEHNPADLQPEDL